MARHHVPRTGHNGMGGTGSPAQGVGRVSFRPMRRHHLPRTGHTGLGGTGSLARGWSDYPSGPMGWHHLPRTGHTGLGGTGSPAQGVVRVSFRAPRGGIIFQEPGTPASGGRGVQPTGWSEYPSGPMGRHHLPRTGHTGLGGTGSLAQGVGGVSFRARGGVSFSKNQAHWPRGDGESSPGGGRIILQGPCGGIIFQEPGTPAWGGRGV